MKLSNILFFIALLNAVTGKEVITTMISEGNTYKMNTNNML